MGRKIKKVIMIAAFGMVTGGQIADLLPEGNVMQVEAGSRKQIIKVKNKGKDSKKEFDKDKDNAKDNEKDLVEEGEKEDRKDSEEDREKDDKKDDGKDPEKGEYMVKKMTGKELVAFCRSKIGTPYVYGMKGKVMTEQNYKFLKNTYGKMVWLSDRDKIGRVCVDCSGLISWACGVTLGSGQWKARATKINPISTIEKAPIGALVWMQGHIGVYTGMKNGHPYYVAADGSAYGVREVPLRCNKFTHWLLVEDVFQYEMRDDEVVEKCKMIINGKEHTVERILKDGTNYIKIRDVAEAIGYSVTSKGNVAVLTKK